MVSSTRNAKRLMIVAKPNQSSTWRNNVILLGALSVPSLGAGIGFALAGAWPILPLAGLEMLALGCALYYVCWKLQWRQVITVSEDRVEVDEGYLAPKQHYSFSRPAAALSVTTEDHPWDGPQLSLHDRNGSVRLGDFLSREDALKLKALLEEEIGARSASSAGSLKV